MNRTTSEDNGQCNGTRVERVKPKMVSTNVRQVFRQSQRPGLVPCPELSSVPIMQDTKSDCLLREYAICTYEAGGDTRSLNFES